MSFGDKLFGGLIHTSHQALNLRMDKQGLIQSNVANIETPGYKTQDFSFDKVMQSVLMGRGNVQITHANHMSLDPVEVSTRMEFTSEDRPVDLDEEMMKISENQLFYQITSKILAKKFEGLKTGIDEASK